MGNVVGPLTFGVVVAARDAQRKCLVVRREVKAPVLDERPSREEFLQALVGFRRRVERAPLDIGTEHEAHLVADVVRAGVETRDLKRRLVAPRRQGEREGERRLLAHAARRGEEPTGEASGRVGLEARHALAVELADVTLALQPTARPRPEVEAVGGNVGVRVRRETRVILRGDLAPAKAQLARRARPVRENRPEERVLAHLGAGEGRFRDRLVRRRRHEKDAFAAHGATLDIARHEQREAARPRPVARVVRSLEDDAVLRRAVDADGARRNGIDEAHPKRHVGKDLDPRTARHDNLATLVSRQDDVEKDVSGAAFGALQCELRSLADAAPPVTRRVGRDGLSHEAENLPRRQVEALANADDAPVEEVFDVARREAVEIPANGGGLLAVEVRQDEHGVEALARPHGGERVPLAPRDEPHMAVADEAGVRLQKRVQLRDERDHVPLGAPVEVVLAVDVDLLRRIPLDAVGHAPRALPREERGELDAQAGVGFAAFGEAVVVVRLGEVDERAIFLGAVDGAGEIPLELPTVVGLEEFRIRPVEVGLREQARRRRDLAAQPLQEEDRVGILAAHFRDDVFPRLGGDHVARVAAEAVHALAAPEEEDVRHVGAEAGLGVVKLDEIRPRDAPRPRRVEAAVRLVAEPVGVVRLQGRRPAGVVGGKVDEEQPPVRVDGADQLLELPQGRDGLVELRHRRIDGEEVGRGERAAVVAHDGVGRRHGKRRQRLNDAEAHLVHDQRQAADDFAETPELAREDAVDGVVLARLGALDLDVQVAPLRPLGDLRALREEARLAGEDAHLVQGNLGLEMAGRFLAEGDVRPRLGERRHALLGLVDDLLAADVAVAEVGAEGGATRARRGEVERDAQRVAAPFEEEGFRGWCLCHIKALRA